MTIPKHCWGMVIKTKEKGTIFRWCLMVDDNGLEPLTLRTSSACSTS